MIKRSLQYLLRFSFHNFGTRGLYNHDWYLRVLQHKNAGWRFDTRLIDPFDIIEIKPELITHVTGRGPNPGKFRWQDIGTIADGDWDQSETQFDELPVVEALRQRYEAGKQWEDIEFIDYVKREAERNNPVWRNCTSTTDIARACSEVDKLYEQIQAEGYRSKRELLYDDNEERSLTDARRRFEPYDEIVIDIGRTGEFLFVDGRHRLAIAKILDLDRIPVRVSARHEQWQRIRELVAETPRTELPEPISAYLDHPDLAAIVDENESGC